ncbi:hypothetical protein LIER_01392 [Lithospermum erythrorhizon]|uniref:Uncharacterized protein n=1 Tax=Lithospermum erythrorhizon TaxID=34254 RepID=A0AAV3NKU7_LITER
MSNNSPNKQMQLTMPPKTKNASKRGQSSKPRTKNTSKRRRATSESNEDVNVGENIESTSGVSNEQNVQVEFEFNPKDDNSLKIRGSAIKTKVSPGGWCHPTDLQGSVVWKRFTEQGGFCNTKVEAWPEDIPSYEEFMRLLNNDFTSPPVNTIQSE